VKVSDIKGGESLKREKKPGRSGGYPQVGEVLREKGRLSVEESWRGKRAEGSHKNFRKKE